MNDKNFKVLVSACKYFGVGFDENRNIELTCRMEERRPKGSSWALCKKEECPFVAKMEELEE